MRTLASSAPGTGTLEAASEPVASATSIGDLLVMTAGRHPDRAAFISGTERRTYRELLENARGVAAGLLALEVGRGERVGVLAPASSGFVETCFGAAMCGAVPVPLSTRYRSTELDFVLEDAGIRTLVIGTAHSVSLSDRLQQISGIAGARAGAPDWRPPRIVLLDSEPGQDSAGCLSWAEFLAGGAQVTREEIELRRAAVRIRDIGWMLYTSGTSSNPKGALLSHEALVRSSSALGFERFRLSEEDRVWIPLPLYHIAGVDVLLASVAAASAFMTMPVFDVDTAIELLERERATVIYPAFPNVVHALLAHPRFENADLSAIRLMINVGSRAVLQEFQDAFPQSVQISGFGLTETSGLVVLSGIDDDEATRLETCGRPFRGVEVKVVDEQRRRLPAGDRGELAIRGFCVFEGYEGAPGRTREVLDDEGWFYTGDLGCVDGQGRVRFHGRIKDVFKVGGENVGAAEVEAFLNSHPAVKISQVVGIPDGRLGAVPAAFIELRPGAQLDGDELVEYCRSRVASYKVPRHVRFVEEWPMSTTKIQKFRLREQLVAELGLAADAERAGEAPAPVGSPSQGRH